MTDQRAKKKELRVLVDLRTALQKQRIALGNRIKAIDDGRDDAPPQTVALFTAWQKEILKLERATEKDVAPRAKEFPILAHLDAIRGIDVMLAAKLISLIDITRCPHVSSLWKRAGYGLGFYYVKDDDDEDARMRVMAPAKGYQWKGKRPNRQMVHVITDPKPGWRKKEISDRPVKGWCLPFDRKLKTACYQIADEFILHNSPYKRIYESRRAHAETTNPDWIPAHRKADAMRVMIKVFLEHLWVTWRKMEGLPTGAPYVHDKLGHDTYFPPEAYGWPPFDGAAEEMPTVAEMEPT